MVEKSKKYRLNGFTFSVLLYLRGMAKKLNPAVKRTSAVGTPAKSVDALFQWLPFQSWATAVWMLSILAFVLYLNTTSNNYALDDGMVILENKYTKEGIKGIGKLLSGDSFEGIFGENASILAGGRYRPLSLITFAIEYQFYGGKDSFPAMSHGINAILYALCVLLAGNWMYRYVFRGTAYLPYGAELAFFATFLFAVHPIHTEAVANLKGRDELLCFIFMMLTLLWLFEGLEDPKTKVKKYILAAGAFFLALLSKENAITFTAIIPLSVYFFHPKKNLQPVFTSAGLFFGVFLLYFLIRVGVTNFSLSDKSTDVLNQPYILASADQKWATKIYVLNKYLSLLFFPYPLSFDYSYAHINYKTFGDMQVWLSIFIHLSMVVLIVQLWQKKHILAYCLLFYLLSISIVSNFVINIGAFLGERFLFQASLGFVIGMAYVVFHGLNRLPEGIRKTAFYGLTGVTLLVAGGWTMSRNQVWKNNDTLFLTDVKTVPNSAKAQKGAGEVLIKQVDQLEYTDPKRIPMLKEAIVYFDNALRIHPQFIDALLEMGATYYRLENWETAEKYWLLAEKLDKNHPVLRAHFALFTTKQLELANRAYDLQDFDKAIALSRKALYFTPQSDHAYFVIGMSYGRKRDFKPALENFEEAIKRNPNKSDYWFNKAGVAFEDGQYELAITAFEKTLQFQPENPSARQGLAAAKSRVGK